MINKSATLRAMSRAPRLRQSGVALPVVMLLMIILLVLSTAGMEDTAMQERMAGNLRDREAAFQAAEAALREGEEWVQNNQATALANPEMTAIEAAAWDGVSPAPIGSRASLYDSSSEIQLASDPVFYAAPPVLLWANGGVEVGVETPRYLYPVIARGVGGSDSAVVVLRTLFEAN
ncbi:PilX N-terminal domain-containing pilus assembly protein [Congregibacter variabilis]|uniref:PilX N-terminal domain-containing pilus assembly protein n=1 Tax=Congregibacter variabilis TaxID=3081200 RepID=A0ABZ0I3R7_9GAMM|nr:PilX N-terminal domain-containing pilus assembly protein [Congregibacter sp. IMCC43200]